MLVVNFSHPFSLAQRAALLAQFPDAEIREHPIQYNTAGDVSAQCRDYVRRALPRHESDVAVRFPAYAGELMLATLYGWLGYWPGQVIIKARAGATPPVFDYSGVCELASVVRVASPPAWRTT